MTGWIAHVYIHRIGDRVERVLSLFAPLTTLQSEFDADLAALLSKCGVVDAIHIVGHSDLTTAVRDWLGAVDSVPLARMNGVLEDVASRVRFVSFEGQYGAHRMETLGEDDCSTLLAAERNASLLSCFRAAGGEELAPLGTHYAKTSQRHADRFLRVSNVLEEANRVHLIAFWLLPWIWKRAWPRIFVDTSSIFSVVMSALHQAYARNGISQMPAISSHRSYAGIVEINPVMASQALFVISASTSDGLVRALCNAGAKADQVVTLFRLSETSASATGVLCDLTGTTDDGLSPIKNHDSANCALCAKQHHLIRIDGDQFSIAPPEVKAIDILAADLSSEQKQTLSALAGLHVFAAFRRHGDRVATLAANAVPLLEGTGSSKAHALLNSIRGRWAAHCRAGLTAALRAVAATGSPAASALANGYASHARSVVKDPAQIEIVDLDGLRHLPVFPDRDAVVMSDCVDDSKDLLAASRTLRKVQPNGGIRYLVPLMLMQKVEADRLIKNVTFGALGPNTFQLQPLIRLDVECHEERSSWADEMAELRALVSWADHSGIDVPTEIYERNERLQRAQSTGLMDDLFWPALDGSPLRLRSDFTLLNESLIAPAATQADLFAVMCVVLTAVRYRDKVADRLQNNAYQRSVLSPANFDRFSDGILQACILRAARPRELAYGACTPQLSEQMLNGLLHALSDPEGDRSEALIEFLVALMTRRMGLHEKDEQALCAKVLETEAAPEVAKIMARYLVGRLGP